jgi:hypothetical protein
MQPKNPSVDKKLTPHPTSPWTEVFQPTTPQPESDNAAPTRTDAKDSKATGADAARATQEALAVIFNNQ